MQLDIKHFEKQLADYTGPRFDKELDGKNSSMSAWCSYHVVCHVKNLTLILLTNQLIVTQLSLHPTPICNMHLVQSYVLLKRLHI